MPRRKRSVIEPVPDGAQASKQSATCLTCRLLDFANTPLRLLQQLHAQL
ncbi:hypothetical protein EYZ11_012460 [Aspergillus tanneri]|uniref:Uncharacterized protein n=1 Tax=Aspergillus tanneri TaxID=1220188 RepID=A0A4S3J0G2_9EURO|nr:hypothetical protein EYZ11_012460 [Aspergillus tanneri]